jgi:transcriptional regulator with XRE-family HTH domain
MATADRALARGRRRGARSLQGLADEFREQRIGLGLSQLAVAAAAGISRTRYTRIEAGRIGNLSIVDASVIASVLGLDLAVRAYAGGDPLRDGGQARKLDAFGRRVGRPLGFRTEVPLPARDDHLEQRAWDAMITGGGERTTIDLEMRIRDAQAVVRRYTLKCRDDPAEHQLLLIADTRSNRRVLAERPALFGSLERLRPSEVFEALEAGRHPPSGLLLV